MSIKYDDWCDCGHAETLHDESPCRGSQNWPPPNSGDLTLADAREALETYVKLKLPILQCECMKFIPGGRQRTLDRMEKHISEHKS